MDAMTDIANWLTTAQRVADGTLFPAALDVDRTGRLPRTHLDELAAAGLYGLTAPAAYGGVGPDRFDVIGDVVAALAGGCLATTFVWIQHLGPVLSMAAAAPASWQQWLGPLARGERRAGIALAGIRPGTGRIHVSAVPGGYQLTGETAWVTGWGLIDTLLIGAVDDDDLVHFLVLDADDAATLTATPTHLLALQASNTVTLRFAGHVVPADRLSHAQPYADWAGTDAFGSTLNGFLSIGLATRCAALMGTDDLAVEISAARQSLLDATEAQIPDARATASLLAARAATELMVQTGSRSMLTDQQAGRLYREAGFLLVFGSRPTIKQAMLHRLRA
jgi:alkylation response protein AidB-like acyl-CoA dehydrogenase